MAHDDKWQGGWWQGGLTVDGVSATEAEANQFARLLNWPQDIEKVDSGVFLFTIPDELAGEINEHGSAQIRIDLGGDVEVTYELQIEMP